MARFVSASAIRRSPIFPPVNCYLDNNFCQLLKDARIEQDNEIAKSKINLGKTNALFVTLAREAMLENGNHSKSWDLQATNVTSAKKNNHKASSKDRKSTP